MPTLDIKVAGRSKNNSNQESTWTVTRCSEALYAAASAGQSMTWHDICTQVAQLGCQAQQKGVNRAFKVTCAVYRKDGYQYHASYKKSLGEYYELEVNYWAGEVIFVYKRTFHNSDGLNIASQKVLQRLEKSGPEAVVTLSHNTTRTR